jgi:hypothetical protein
MKKLLLLLVLACSACDVAKHCKEDMEFFTTDGICFAICGSWWSKTGYAMTAVPMRHCQK